jgi:hypothetical protein
MFSGQFEDNHEQTDYSQNTSADDCPDYRRMNQWNILPGDITENPAGTKTGISATNRSACIPVEKQTGGQYDNS